MGGVVAGLGLWRNSAWADYHNFHQRTVGTFFRDVKEHGLRNTREDRALWGRMRMTPTDIADVTGYTYTQGWIGHDVNRFWFRTEGEAEGRGVADAYADALFGRAIRLFWDVVAGVRQDF